LDYLKSQSEQSPITFSFSMVENLDDSLSQLLAWLHTRKEALGHPLRVLMDISNCPDYFTMGLLAMSTALGMVRRWRFFYSEANYPTGAGKVTFTHGNWRVRPVPGLQKPVDPALPRTVVVGLGFEGSKARWLATRYEPSRLFAVLPRPGFTDEYTRRAAKENTSLLKDIRSVGRAQVLPAAAGDSVGVVEALVKARVADGRHNVILVPTGPKPHALGMALYSMLHPLCTVLYRNPERFEIKDSQPNGKCWCVDVHDRSAIIPHRRRRHFSHEEATA
jgi:hypothetical protein